MILSYATSHHHTQYTMLASYVSYTRCARSRCNMQYVYAARYYIHMHVYIHNNYIYIHAMQRSSYAMLHMSTAMYYISCTFSHILLYAYNY